MLTEVFGVKGSLGDLTLEPKLAREQFDTDGKASVSTLFAGRRLNVTYYGASNLAYGQYRIKEIRLDDEPVLFELRASTATLSRETVVGLAEDRAHNLDVILG